MFGVTSERDNSCYKSNGFETLPELSQEANDHTE